MPGWIGIILLAASLGRWRINIIPCVNTSFSSSWHCWRAMGWECFKGGFWELFVTIQQQGEELFMGCRNSLYNEVFWPKPLPRRSPVPPITYGMGQDLPGSQQAPVPEMWQWWQGFHCQRAQGQEPNWGWILTLKVGFLKGTTAFACCRANYYANSC